MNLTDIVTLGEFEAFMVKRLAQAKAEEQEEATPEFKARTDRLAPMLQLLVHTIPDDIDPVNFRFYMAGMLVFFDELLEHATGGTKQ